MDRGQAEKFNYFIQRSAEDFAEIKEEFKILNQKVDKLWTFRMLLIGMSTGVSGLLTVAINIAFIYFGIKK